MCQDLEATVAEITRRFGSPSPDLHVVTSRTSAIDPARFLSGASLTAAEVAQFAVPRRVDIHGSELDLGDVAARISSKETVAYLMAGAGEGKSTYLHALSSSMLSRAIVCRWRVTSPLDWQGIRDFQDLVSSAQPTDVVDEAPLVIIGEVATKLNPEQEDALVETVQGIPSGLASAGTSIVLAGRPAWLNRIRHGASTGFTMRLMPLASAEAEALSENLADAHAACIHEYGRAWTESRFPNLARFLAQTRVRQVELLQDGPSLVGPMLQAAYGGEFLRRLRTEYSDLDRSDRAAYLLVSFATSSLGGISEELLESMCPEANIERASAGSPWQRNAERIHSARHEMIGRVVLEDKGGATSRDISEMTGELVEAAGWHREALKLFFSSVRVLDESVPLVPLSQRKTEPQFRGAVRAGVLGNREAWERLEKSIGTDVRDILDCAYVIHRLLPDTPGAGESNEYLLGRAENLLTLAEKAATPGSAMAERARYHRIFIARDARRVRGDVVENCSDFRTLMPMIGRSWTRAPFYAQLIWLGLSTLEGCHLDSDEHDQVAGAVLECWQRLRVEGEIRVELQYAYSSFVARDLYLLASERRLALWEAAWELSRSLGHPDGALACLIDADLAALEKRSVGQDAALLLVRRRHVLSETVVGGQTNAEAVLRLADAFAADEEAQTKVRRIGGALASARGATTRSMARHALAIVASSDDERVKHLCAAISAYEGSVANRDDWLTRGRYWKRALRELRAIAPDLATGREGAMVAAAQKYRS